MTMYFHVLSDPKLPVKEISGKEYFKALNRKGWLVGHISKDEVWLHRQGYSTIYLTMKQVTEILWLKEGTHE